MSVKIIQPPLIEIPPLGNQENIFSNGSSSRKSSDGTQTGQEIQIKSLPNPEHAREVISKRLDTVAGQITAGFEFSESGAIRISSENTGKIEITGDGVTAINQTGETTFFLDGRNGDAVFAGELAAGSVMTGKIDMGADGYIIGGDTSTYRWILGKLPS